MLQTCYLTIFCHVPGKVPGLSWLGTVKAFDDMAMSILYAHRVKKYEKNAKKKILKFSKSAIKQRFCYHFEVVKV